MMELYKNIRMLREKRGLSQSELASMTGYRDRSSIAKIEKGEVDLSQSKISAFAKALQVTESELMGLTNASRLQDMPHNIQMIDKIKLPMLGSIACGEPIYADEDRESYVLAGTDIRADFCLRASGDSMINARIRDGDIVFIRQQDMVNNGEIAAVIIDDSATLKRFYYYKQKGMIILRAENPKYEDIILTGEELENVRILGKAVAFQSDTD